MQQQDTITTQFRREVATGQRFEFGSNWRRFLASLDEERITQAELSLRRYMGVETLQGRSFLDIGSGSGLFSLAARRLGAKVHSFDYDPQSVACTAELKRRFFPDDAEWTVEQGSALDASYLRSLGTFDIVYSWGVLHHTGAMWQALENVMLPVAPGGQLYLAIYNDQGKTSERWRRVKHRYNRTPRGLKWVVLWPTTVRLWWKDSLKDALRGKPFATWRSRKRQRGMSAWRDVIDWVGGYPFEVAKPEQIFLFYRDRGFVLENLKTCGGGLGCNEFLLRRTAA